MEREIVVLFQGNSLCFPVYDAGDEAGWKKVLDDCIARTYKGEVTEVRRKRGAVDTVFLVSGHFIGYYVRDRQPCHHDKTAEFQERMLKMMEKGCDPDADEPWRKGGEASGG